MTPVDLRELAAYHGAVAQEFRFKERSSVTLNRAAQHRHDAQRHEAWARKLTELADSFYAFAANQ